MAPFKITLKEKRRKVVAKGQQLQPQPQPQSKNGNVDAALGPITSNLHISFTLPRNRGPSSVPPLSKNREENVSIRYLRPRSKSSRIAKEEEVQEIEKNLVKICARQGLEVVLEGIKEMQEDLEQVQRHLCALQEELSGKPYSRVPDHEKTK